jgi:hypothetical protein
MMDKFSSGWAVLIIGFFEFICIGYVYGKIKILILFKTYKFFQFINRTKTLILNTRLQELPQGHPAHDRRLVQQPPLLLVLERVLARHQPRPSPHPRRGELGAVQASAVRRLHLSRLDERDRLAYDG